MKARPSSHFEFRDFRNVDVAQSLGAAFGGAPLGARRRPSEGPAGLRRRGGPAPRPKAPRGRLRAWEGPRRSGGLRAQRASGALGRTFAHAQLTSAALYRPSLPLPATSRRASRASSQSQEANQATSAAAVGRSISAVHLRASIFVIGVPFSRFPFDAYDSTRVGAPRQALRACSQSHFQTPYGTVGYPPVGSGGRPFAYVGVSYRAVRYSYVGVTYEAVTYHGVTFAYVTVTYHGVSYRAVSYLVVTYPDVTYCYVVVTYGYVGKGHH
nr:MAG TPA: hypothetical protein [Caudoviricetes sp.]